MNLFDVYPLYDIELVKAKGCFVFDTNGNKYLDMYGGHAVISIGHNHDYFVEKLKNQLDNIAFYSNSVINSLQIELAAKLGEASGYEDYSLFLCNTGAEAVENALKLASFKTRSPNVIAFKNSFHGRTSGALAVTDNQKITSLYNRYHKVDFENFDAIDVYQKMGRKEIAAVIFEGIQGVAGIIEPNADFIEGIQILCKKHKIPIILDEVQSGYGRTGKFFAHQHHQIKPDLITIAKGMGNGFPVAGVLISPEFEAKHSLLGTTFGGNHMACAAAISVLDVIKNENLMENASTIGNYIMTELKKINNIKEIRGRGLMLGIEFDFAVKELRNKLLNEFHIFTGYAGTNVLRLLPPLSLSKVDADYFLDSLGKIVN